MNDNGRIEQLARALCELNGVDPDQVGGTWDGGRLPRDKPAWTNWEVEAKVAIEMCDRWHTGL